MQVLGRVRHPRPGAADQLNGRAPAPIFGASARAATERSAAREHLQKLKEPNGNLACLLRQKTERGAGCGSSQLMRGESGAGGAEEVDPSSGRDEVHKPLRVFIKQVYAENSSLGRFLRAWRSQPAQDPGQTTGCKSVGGSACRRGLFPCAAPTLGREGKQSASSRSRQRQSDRALVDDLVTLQVGVASWIACGSTPTPPKSLQAPTTEAHQSMLGLAREQALRFARASRKVKPTVSSGRAGASLVEELRALEKACSEMGDEYLGTLGKAGKAGLRLEAEKLSLPPEGTAGGFDITSLLSAELREAFLDPSVLATKVHVPKAPKIASAASAVWLQVLARLDVCGILWLACERELPRGFSGEDLKSGLFAVGKDDGTLRTILNRVLRNAIEESRDGVTPTFPHGSTLAEIFLEECEKLRISVDDLPDFYHWIRISYARILTNGFGPPISHEEARKMRAWERLTDEQREEITKTGRAATCWGVLPMGDRNSVSFAQEAHANLLREGGGLTDDELIVYRRPWPAGKTAEGVMVDDHAVVHKARATESKAAAEAALQQASSGRVAESADVARDVELVARSLQAYRSHGLAPKPAKSVRFEDGQIDLWGATVHGTEGWVRGKLSVLWRAILVTLELKRLRRTTQRLWRLLLGLWSHSLSFRREGYAFLQEAYAFTERFESDREVRRVPERVLTELTLLVAFASTFEQDLRAPLSATWACTDASSRFAASVEAKLPEHLGVALWAHREQRRGYVRCEPNILGSLAAARDHGDEYEAQVLSNVVARDEDLAEYVRKGEARAPWFEEIVAGTQFEKRFLYRVREDDHINVSEAKAYMTEVRRASRDAKEHRKRRLYGLDSFVAIGAGSKGRASSRRLNPVYRSGAPTLLLCRMHSGFNHIRSAWNPADDPTRGKPVRVAQQRPAWAADASAAAAREALEAAHPVLRQRRGAPRGLFPSTTLQPPEQSAVGRKPSPVETDGEAANPGPRSSSSSSSAASLPRGRPRTREGRALARAEQPSVRHRTLSRTEKNRRAAELQRFKDWLTATQGTSLEATMQQGAEYTAETLADYGGSEFRAGGTKGDYVATINAVCDMRRSWRRAMTPAWDVVSEWSLREPGKPRAPVPEAGVRAAITLACCLRWTAFALFLAFGWCAALRPGELLKLRRRDVTLPTDLASQTSPLFLRLRASKTSRKHGAATHQHARIEAADVIELAEAYLGELRPKDRIFGWKYRAMRAQWDELFKRRLGFERLTPSGLRSGGATDALLAGGLESARLRLRHLVNSRSTERYLQEAGAAFAYARVPPEARARVATLAAATPAAASLRY